MLSPLQDEARRRRWLTLLHQPRVPGLPAAAGATLDQRAGCWRGLWDELGLGLEDFNLLLGDALGNLSPLQPGVSWL